MQGIVFCEFVDFVEQVAGEDIADQMIMDADVPSGGAYTSVGQYEFQELAQLIGALSKLLSTPAPDLIKIFGKHLFGRLNSHYPHFTAGVTDPLSFLETVQDYIHVEVKKLYPDAELPTLTTERVNSSRLKINYQSCRPLGQLCIGLLEGSAEFFEVNFDISSKPTEQGLEIIVDLVDVANQENAA